MTLKNTPTDGTPPDTAPQASADLSEGETLKEKGNSDRSQMQVLDSKQEPQGIKTADALRDKFPDVDQEETLNRRGLYRKLGKVAVPIALQSFIGTSLSFVDNLMVGSLGESHLNAVGVGVQIYFIHWMVLFGFTSGCATFMAQFFGAKDMKSIRKTVGFAITITVSVSLLFFIVSTFFPTRVMGIFTDFPEIIKLGAGYIRTAAFGFLLVAITVPLTTALRATQQTKYPMFASIAAFLLNTGLNYMLIFGNFGAPKMGVIGAALATVIARVLELLLILLLVFARKNCLTAGLKHFFSYKKAFAFRIVKNAIPTTANETLWGLGTALYIAAFARVSITAGAAVQACNTINNMFILAGFSIGDAALILVGQKLGEGQLRIAYQMAKQLLKVAAGIGLLAGTFMVLTGKLLLRLFSFTPQGERLAFLILVVYACVMWIALYNSANIVGVLRCGGDTKYAMATEVLSIWCIGVPLAFLTALVLHWPIYLAVLAVKCEEVIKAIVVTRRFLSKKWVKNVIHHMDN